MKILRQIRNMKPQTASINKTNKINTIYNIILDGKHKRKNMYTKGFLFSVPRGDNINIAITLHISL